MKKKTVLALSALLAAGMGTGIVGAAEETIRIGVVAPLTGAIASDGKYVREGTELAYDELEDGILEVDGTSYKIEMVYEDTEAKPEVATNAYQKLIEESHVSAIIGPNTSSCMLSAGPLAQEAGIANIATTATNPATSEIGDCMFRVCFTDDYQGQVIAEYLSEILTDKTVAILYNNASEYSVGLTETFEKFFEEYGGTVVEKQAFGGLDVKDFNAQLTKIKAADPECVFFPETSSVVALQYPQARNLGIESLFVSADGCDTPEMVDLVSEDVLEGVLFTSPFYAGEDTPIMKDFVGAYTEKYGYEPGQHALLGYEATKAVLEAIKNAGSGDPAAVRDALNDLHDLELPSGKFNWDENRNPIKGCCIMEWKSGEKTFVKKIEPEA